VHDPVALEEAVPVAGRGGGDVGDGCRQLAQVGGAEVGGVAEGEHGTVGRRQPVAVAGGRGRQTHDRCGQVPTGRRTE
jgi:hypothetical protein